MIDTDKYEGHTEGPWNADCAEPDAGLIANIDAHDHTVARMVNGCLADTQLIADAPLLLAEVKRLNELIEQVIEVWEICNHEDRNDWFYNFCRIHKEEGEEE